MAAQREWYEKDYYKVLGVSDDAPAKDITKAYRKLARANHPDTHPGDDAAEERFKEISAAYDVLGDEAKRKEYDEVRKLGPIGGFQPGGPGQGGFNFNVGSDGLGDLLGQMSGRGRRGGGPSAAAGPQRGADVEATLTLDFADAAQGITTTLHLTSDAQCSTCHGSGAKPGTQPVVCSNCGGRGVIDDNQGMAAANAATGDARSARNGRHRAIHHPRPVSVSCGRMRPAVTVCMATEYAAPNHPTDAPTSSPNASS